MKPGLRLSLGVRHSAPFYCKSGEASSPVYRPRKGPLFTRVVILWKVNWRGKLAL